MPHAVPTDRQISLGDVITIDMGCSYNGYCSDMTRTVFVDHVSENIERIYNLVLENQMLALNEMKDGSNIKTISRIIEGNFKMHGYELMHALGHGIGLNVHEGPIISPKSEKTLKENMVTAVEPGIYVPTRYGVRIEDTVLITKDGAEPLTKSPKNYCIVG